jgi:hemoglobin
VSEEPRGGEPPCSAHVFTDHDIESRADVEDFVRAFYRDAAMDDVLGPVFHAARVDWSVHIPKLVDFWSWQLLGERGYEGNPLRAHEPSHARTPFTAAHYERWLDLFTTTIDDRFAGQRAELAKSRARRMATALRRLLEGEHGAGDEAVEVMRPSTRPPAERS